MLEFDVWNVNMDMVLVVLIVEVRKIQKVTVTFFFRMPCREPQLLCFVCLSFNRRYFTFFHGYSRKKC